MKIVFLDIEANGYHEPDSREALQIGAIKCDYDTGKLSYFNQMIKPQRYKGITKHCFEITGISNQDLKKEGRPFEEVIENFEEFIKDSIVLSWDEFDFVQLRRDVKNRNFKGDFIERLDKNYFNYQKIYQLKTGLEKKPALIKTIENLGLQHVDNLHDAMNDAMNLKILFDATDNPERIEDYHKFKKEVFIDLGFSHNSPEDLEYSIYTNKKNQKFEYELLFEEKFQNKKVELKLNDEIVSLIENSIAFVPHESVAEKLICSLNKKGIWNGIYIKNY